MAWSAVLTAVFLLLCLRFEIAASRSSGANLSAVLCLITGGFVIGAWNSQASLFAVTVAVPLLVGLGQTGMLNCVSPLSVVFSAYWLGSVTTYLRRRAVMSLLVPTGWVRDKELSSIVAADDYGNIADSKAVGKLGRSILRQPLATIRFSFLASEILSTAVVLSLFWQVWRHIGLPEAWRTLSGRAEIGYGDRWYFLCAAFVWLQGLFYFKLVLGSSLGLLGDQDEQNGKCIAVKAWVRLFFVVYCATMLVFFAIQYTCHIPEGWAGRGYPTGWVNAGFQAPYEDISSFGSIAAAVFIFMVATLGNRPWYKLAIGGIVCGSMLTLVVASWSRAAWLAGVVFLLMISAARLSHRWTAALILVVVAALLVINSNANRASWTNKPYLFRLIALARFEKLTNKDSGRINLYKKALGMIRQHPIVGHGIGSFYLESVKFGDAKDPYSDKPDFAHNVILQMAAEEGLAVAALYTCLIGWTLWCGIHWWLQQARVRHRCSTDRLLVLGMTLSLCCYVETQMTANSLNVYSSNQFFFWFLMAIIVTTSERAGAAKMQ